MGFMPFTLAAWHSARSGWDLTEQGGICQDGAMLSESICTLCKTVFAVHQHESAELIAASLCGKCWSCRHAAGTPLAVNKQMV